MIACVFLGVFVSVASFELVLKMIPDKAPGEDVLHASGDFKKEAHIPSFEKYKELYIKSVESPEGEFHLVSLSWYFEGKSFTWLYRKALCNW